MAVTVPTFYRFARDGSGIYYPKDILASDVGLIRDNSHHLYATVGLRSVESIYWPDGLVTTATSAETVLEIPFRIALDRNFTDSITVMGGRTGTASVVTLILRDASDSTTIDTATISSGNSAFQQEMDPDTEVDLILRVRIHVATGSGGLSYLRVMETPMSAGDLP